MTSHDGGVALSNRTIAALAEPFDGGRGPSHSTIELIWTSAGAIDYLGEGNKLQRVLGGLRALRDGRPPEGGHIRLPADPEKLQSVASELATRLVATGFVDAAIVQDALEEGPVAVADADLSTTSDNVRASVDHDAHSLAGAAISQPSGYQSAAGGIVEDPRVVMVVHGQDPAAARAMFDWLRAMNLRPQEWSQLVKSSGAASPFIGEVLETAFRRAQAVVVLFTPDEQARVRPELVKGRSSWRLQARPNVLFEAGMAFATHPERTVLVVLGDQEIPSDLAGRHYVRLGSVGALRDLAQRLEQAGCPVDLTGNDWLDVERFPGRSEIAAAPV
jgi:predicted nucleotide-binding protein